jgi:hypothetical protein
MPAEFLRWDREREQRRVLAQPGHLLAYPSIRSMTSHTSWIASVTFRTLGSRLRHHHRIFRGFGGATRRSFGD